MGGRGKHRTYPEEGASKDKALRKKIKELEAENKRLKAELKTLNKVLKEDTDFIHNKLEFVPLENLIENISFIEKFEKSNDRKETKVAKKAPQDSCPKCSSETKSSSLPFGKLRICVNQCGWREVVREDAKKTE